MPDKINELYNILIEKQKLGQVGNIPELGEFTKNILDPQQARAMYDAKKERFPDVFYGNNFDEWYSTVKKKEPTESKTGSKDLPKAESESESRFTQKTKQEFEELKEIPKTNFERRLYDKSAPFLKNEDGSISTHEMTSFEADGKFYAAPTIVEKNGKLTRLKPEEAIDFALKSGEYKKFDTDQEAKAYAEGGYKKNTLLDQPKKPKKSTWTTTLTDYENNLKPKETKEPLFNQNATELMKKGYDALAVDSNDIDKILGQTGDIFSMKPDAVKIAPRYGDEKYTSEEMAGKVKRSEASLQYFQELDKKRTEQLNIFADKYKEIAQSKLASIDSELKNYDQTMDAAYKKQVQDFKNSLPQPKTQQEAEVLNKQLQDFNKKAFDATQKNIQDFTEKKSAEYRDFVTKNVNEAWDKEANAGARVYDEKNLNRIKGIFESEKFQKLPYIDQKALVGSVWYREKLRLMKAGKTPKEIADAKDWFYLNSLGSAISNPKNKTPLSPFAIRSWAENMGAEIDQKIAEQEKLLPSKNLGLDQQQFIPEMKDLQNLLQAKELISEIKNLPDEKLGNYWEGVTSADKLPFASSVKSIGKLSRLLEVSGKENRSKAEDLLLLSQGMKDDIESAVDPGFAYKVGKQTAEMLPYIGEMILTGGAYTGAQKVATEVLTKKLGSWGASKIAQKAIVKPLAALVGTAAQTVVNPQMYIKNTLERMSPRFEASFSEKGNEVVAKLDYNTKDLAGYSTGKGEDFFTASLKSLGLTASELFTERLGESLLTPAAKAAAKKIFGDPELAKRMTLAMWLKKRNLTPEQGVMEIITKKMAWDGILSELGEELINMPLSNIISDRPIGEGMEPDNLAVLATSIASVGAVTGGLTLAGKAFGDKTVPLQYRVGEEERSIDVNPDMLKAVQYMAKKPDYFEIEQFKNSVFTNVDMPEEDREILVGIINSIQDKADLKPFTEQARPIFNRIGTDEEAKPRTDKDEIIDITDYQTDAEKEEAEGYAMQLPAKVTPEQELQNIENALSVGNLTDQETNALKQRYKNVVDAMQKPIDIEQPKEQPKEESKQKPAPAAKTEQPETELKAVEWTPQVNDRIVRLVDAYNAMTPAKRNSKKGQALISEIGKSAGAHNLDLKEVKDKNTTKLEVYKGDKKLRKTPVPKEFEDPTDEQYAFAQRAITYGLIPPGSDIGLTDSELDKSKKALMAGKKTKEALRLVHAIDKAKKFNGVEVAFIDSLGRKTGGRSFVSFSEIEELMNQNYTGPKLNPDEEEALAEAYYELYDSLDDEAKEELDNLFLTDNEIQDENEQQKAQAKQAGSGKKDEDDIRGAEKAAAKTEVDEPIQVMREISSKRPDLKDMFDEAEFYYNKMKSIREQIGFEKGQGLFVGINETPSLPFPYRLNSVLFSGQKSSDEARQKALNDFKQNLEAAKEYFKNPPSESEIKEAKEKLAEENKIKQESTKQKIDSTKENLIRLKEIYESEQDFINEIYPNKKESDRTIELLLFEGLDKSTIRKIKEINDVFLSLGEPSSFSKIKKIMKPLLYSASNLANAISRKDVDLFSADKKLKAIEAINAISEKYNEQVKAIAPAQNLTTIGIDASKFEGLLNKNQAENLQKEIERNYTPLDVIELGEKGKDIRKNVYNYDNPIAERNIDGINFRIAQGLLRVDSSGKKVKSYLLYANGKIIGEFNSIEKSKSAVQFIEKSLIKETPQAGGALEVGVETTAKELDLLLEKATDLQNKNKTKELHKLSKDYREQKKAEGKTTDELVVRSIVDINSPDGLKLAGMDFDVPDDGLWFVDSMELNGEKVDVYAHSSKSGENNWVVRKSNKAERDFWEIKNKEQYPNQFPQMLNDIISFNKKYGDNAFDKIENELSQNLKAVEQFPKTDTKNQEAKSKLGLEEFNIGDEIIWEGKKATILSKVKMGKEWKYNIELPDGKNVWTNYDAIQSEKSKNDFKKITEFEIGDTITDTTGVDYKVLSINNKEANLKNLSDTAMPGRTDVFPIETVARFKSKEQKPVAYKGNVVSQMAVSMGSDQGGISEFTARKIEKEDYEVKNVLIEGLLDSDKDLAEYIENTEEVRDFEGEPFEMLPIVTSSGEVLDGYNRIHQAIVNGETFIEVYYGVKPSKKTKTQQKPAPKKVGTDKVNSALDDIGNIFTEQDFQYSAFDELKEGKSDLRKEYEQRVKDAEAEIKAKQKEIDAKKKELSARNADVEARNRILSPMLGQINVMQQEYRKILSQESSVKEAEKSQLKLFEAKPIYKNPNQLQLDFIDPQQIEISHGSIQQMLKNVNATVLEVEGHYSYSDFLAQAEKNYGKENVSKAVFEYITQRSILSEFKAQKFVSLKGKKLHGPQDVADAVLIFRSAHVEHSMIIVVNSETGEVVHNATFTLNHPGATYFVENNIIIENILSLEADLGIKTSLYLVHNHPSGNHRPSDADIKLTEKLSKDLDESKINFAGHVIVNTTKFTFISRGKDGFTDIQTLEYNQKPEKLFSTRLSLKDKFEPSTMMSLGKILFENKGFNDAVLFLDSYGSISALTIVPAGMNKIQLKDWLKTNLIANGARNYIVYSDGNSEYTSSQFNYSEANDYIVNKNNKLISSAEYTNYGWGEQILTIKPIVVGAEETKLNYITQALSQNEIAAKDNLQKDSKELTNGWYSRLLELVKSKGNTQSGEQWQKWIEARANEGKISREEVYWTGLQEFIEDKKSNKIPVSEVIDFLRFNKVEIAEKILSIKFISKSGASNLGKFKAARLILAEQGIYARFSMDRESINFTTEQNKEIDNIEDFTSLMVNVGQITGAYLFENNQIEFEKLQNIANKIDLEYNYSKIKDMLPASMGVANFKNSIESLNILSRVITRSLNNISNLPDLRDVVDSDAGDLIIDSTRLQYTSSNLTNKKEIVLYVPTIRMTEEQKRFEKPFAGKLNEILRYKEMDEIHFGTITGGKALVWIRFGDVTTEDGRKVMVIDEIQSQRHEAGRDLGYQKMVYYAYDTAKKQAITADWEDKTELEKAYINELADPNIEIRQRMSSRGVPDAPFKKTYTDLAVKRALRFAAENGYDFVAWNTGEQVSRRFNISQVVDTINYSYNSTDDLYFVSAELNQVQKFNQTDISLDEIKEIFGATIANKIATGEGREYATGLKEIKIDEQTIGAEPMKKYYGSVKESRIGDVGKITEKIAKSFDRSVNVAALSLTEAPKLTKQQARQVFESQGYNVITDRNGDTYVEKDEENYDFNKMSATEQEAFDILVADNLDARKPSDNNAFTDGMAIPITESIREGILSQGMFMMEPGENYKKSVQLSPENIAKLQGLINNLFSQGHTKFEDIMGMLIEKFGVEKVTDANNSQGLSMLDGMKAVYSSMLPFLDGEQYSDFKNVKNYNPNDNRDTKLAAKPDSSTVRNQEQVLPRDVQPSIEPVQGAIVGTKDGEFSISGVQPGGDLFSVKPISVVSGESSAREVSGREPRMGDGDTASGRLEQSSLFGTSGVQPKSQPRATDEKFDSFDGSQRQYTDKVEAQKNAPTNAIVGDIKNIAATLPYLMDGQVEDVWKAETRLFKDGKKGILFGNQTGTGKTFLFLGLVKRTLLKNPNANIVIISPTGPIQQTINSAKILGIDIKQVEGIKDSGSQVAITTYQNMYQNKGLLDRVPDLVIFDESHNLLESKEGREGVFLQSARKLMATPNEAFQKAAEMIYGKRPEFIEFGNNEDYKAWNETVERNKKAISIKAKELQQKTKVMLMSATPFAHEFTLRYADGLLFDINQGVERLDSGAYNAADNDSLFFITNFGYRMRYNKLTQPDAKVNMDAMYRAFADKLMKEGAMSVRLMDVPFDYSREFIDVAPGIGVKIDEGIKILNSEKYRFPTTEAFSYQYMAPLLEAIKAEGLIERVKQHIAMGRKVVVFHGYNNPVPEHPFGDRLKMFAKSEQQEKALDLFWIENPEFKNMFLGLKNPITKFKEEFGDKVLLFNGPISQSERESAMKKFNTDPNSNLILVNISAGGAGLSLHDQFGDKQRVLINLGLPVRPVQAIQVEGRIYRTGQKSNAIFEYAKTGLDFEMFMFGTRIAERVNATESLVMGSMGRNLKEVFKTGYINSVSSEPNLEQGLGGKEGDKSMYTLTPYEFAKSFYWGQQKGRKTELGTDYFATPEPIGFKMVEFADVRSGDKILEPSAGHGAIARFVPEDATLHIIEPSSSLLARLLVVASPSRTFDGNFEDYYIGNYYNAVVMNPPFGTAGKTAVEHFIKGFNHLYNGGRIVAIIPNGQGEKRFTDWYESEEANTAVLVAKIEMPAMFSERAGTGALTSIYIVDKIDNPEQRSGLPSPVYKSFADAKDNNELFDRIENFSVRPRPEVAMSQKEMTDKEVDDSKPMFTDHEYIANNGQKWLIVRPVNRFGVDVFKSLVNIAKSSNGWYMQKGGKGFAFKESSDASQFKIDAKEFILKDSGTPNVDEMINMAEEDLRNYVRDSMGKMSVNPFAATIEFGVKAAKLMGLYIRKGMKSLPEFLKKFGLQPSQFMRDLWLKVNEFKDKMWRQPKNITTLKQDYSFIGMRNQPYFGAVLNRSFDGTESAYQINFNLNSEIATIDTLIQNNPNGSMVPMLQLVKKATQEILNFISGMSHVEAMEYVDDLRRDRLPAPILYDYTYTEKERLIYNLVYGFRPVETIIKNIREAGGIIEESRNPVMGTDLYPGRVANKARVFEEIVLSSVKDAFGKPVNEPSLIEKMKADGINIGEVNAKTQTEYGKLMPGFYLSYTYGYETMPSFPEYLHALHAKERNEEVARRRREIFENRKIELEALIQNKINVALNTEKLQILLANLDPEYQLIDDGGSGMTNAEAESILNEMRNWPEKLELYNKYAREFTEKVILPIQKELVESGQISQSKLDELNETFGNWVHLPVDFYSNSMSGAGMASVNVRTPLKRVTGSVDRRVNPFLATIDYYSKVIRAGEMNKARQQMYNLIKTYPNENLFKLHSSVSGVAYNPDSGELEPIIRNQPPNSIPVYRNGRIYYIQFIGSNGQILFNAWNSINNTHDRTLIHRFFRTINAALFYANIKFNPTFLISNLLRDDFTAVFNSLTLSETKRTALKSQVAAKIPLYTPKAIRAAYQASRGKVSNVDKDMLEYAVKLQQEGGITIMGNLTGASNLQDRLDNIGKLINEMDESTLLQQLSMPGSYLLNALGDMQQAVENGTRLAAFRSLIEAGVPVQTAAAAAKNLTINFDRKGAKAGAINDFIWLFKTSASGIIRFGSALNTKEGKIIASALVGLGVMLSMWNRSVCEDGWNNVDDQIKYSKFVFIMNCEHQVYPSLPFAHGWGLFLYLGQLMESYSSGAKTKSQAVGNAVVAIVNTVNPLGSSQDFETFGEKFAPTAIQKVTEFTANRTWYDKPIAPEQFRFEEKIKDSELYWDETSEWAVELAKWLSENTGGELAKNEGAIELSPSTLEYLFKTIAGGAGRDVTGLGVVAKDIKEGKLGENITKYPLIRALVTKASSQKVQSELYKIYERGQLNPIENSDNEKFMALARMRAVQIQKIVEPEKQVKEAKRLYDLINSYQKLQLKDELSKTFRDKNLKELSQILSLLKSKR